MTAGTGIWEGCELVPVACDRCGGTEHAELLRRPDSLRVVECARCGLCFVNPRPHADLIRQIYDGSYFSESDPTRLSGVGYASYLDGPERSRALMETRTRMAIVRRHIRLEGAGLLEAGCATGEFCGEAASLGATAHGVDLSARAIEIAGTRHPECAFDAVELENATGFGLYDVVCAFEVIEHAESPGRFMEMLSMAAIPGGWVVVSTPNVDCARKIGPERWLGFTRSFEHLYYLSIDDLAHYGERAGLSPVEWYTFGGLQADRSGDAPDSPLVGVLKFALRPLARRYRRFMDSGRRTLPYRRRGHETDLVAIMRKDAV